MSKYILPISDCCEVETTEEAMVDHWEDAGKWWGRCPSCGEQCEFDED